MSALGQAWRIWRRGAWGSLDLNKKVRLYGCNRLGDNPACSNDTSTGRFFPSKGFPDRAAWKAKRIQQNCYHRERFICLWYYIKSSKHMNCTCWFEHHRREFATLSFNVTTNQPTCSWKRLAWMVSSRMLRGLMWKDLTHNLMRSLGWMVVERVTFSTRFASCWESRTCNRCEEERCIFNARNFDRFNSFHYFDARFERIACKSSYTSKGKLGSPRQRFPSCLTMPTRKTVLLDMNTWTKLLWQGN